MRYKEILINLIDKANEKWNALSMSNKKNKLSLKITINGKYKPVIYKGFHTLLEVYVKVDGKDDILSTRILTEPVTEVEVEKHLDALCLDVLTTFMLRKSALSQAIDDGTIKMLR